MEMMDGGGAAAVLINNVRMERWGICRLGVRYINSSRMGMPRSFTYGRTRRLKIILGRVSTGCVIYKKYGIIHLCKGD